MILNHIVTSSIISNILMMMVSRTFYALFEALKVESIHVLLEDEKKIDQVDVETPLEEDDVEAKANDLVKLFKDICVICVNNEISYGFKQNAHQCVC